MCDCPAAGRGSLSTQQLHTAAHKPSRLCHSISKPLHRLNGPLPAAAQSYKLLDISISNEIWRAPVAASCLGGLLVLLFNILSCAILIK